MAVYPHDIAVAIGRDPSSLTAEQASQWQLWIDDARLLILARLRRETGPADELSSLDQPTLDYVVRESVVHHIRHPDDATQVDVQIDDGRVSKRFASSTGRVTIRAEWWELLFPGAEESAFTVTPYASADTPVVTEWA